MNVEILRESTAWQDTSVPASAVFITYNHERYVADALQSVLAQTYPLDIVISDDASTDRTVDVIRAIVSAYDGPHRIRLRAGTSNLGVVGNQNATLPLAEGELIVLFEGDDISEPTRVRKLVDRYVEVDRAVAALGSGIVRMDEAGRLGDVVLWPLPRAGAREITSGEWGVHGCTLAIRRDCVDRFGPITSTFFSGDGPLWMRAAFLPRGGAAQVREPLVRYRTHGSNVSSRIRVDYESVATLRASCRYLLSNEVAQLVELARIRRVIPLSEMTERQRAAYRAVRRVTRKRARLVRAIGWHGRARWLGPLASAGREPQLRPFVRGVLSVMLPRGIVKAIRAVKLKRG